MEFLDLLLEKFKTGVEIHGQYVEIYVEPTWTEVKRIMKDNQADTRGTGNTANSVRFGATDQKRPVIYAWRGDIIHNDIIYYSNLPLKGFFGFYYAPKYKNGKNVFFHDSNYFSWEKYKNKEALIKKIKKLYPSIKSLYFNDINKKKNDVDLFNHNGEGLPVY